MLTNFADTLRANGRKLDMRILLADDDVAFALLLSKSLESEGYEVHTALDETAVLDELRLQNYKLIILDLNFGRTDGLKLLERLRAGGVSTPVIVLSARHKVSDRIESLNLGADDYMTKPFSFQELAARANALLRRKADPSLNILRVADLELDPATRRVTRGGVEIKLSSKEFNLLHLLVRRAGNHVTRQELLHEVWGSPPGSDSNLVDVYVNYLRRKLEHFRVVDGSERIDEENKLIHTIRGVGYRIGPEASLPKVVAVTGLEMPEPSRAGMSKAQAPPGFSGATQTALQTPWRALVSSLSHDLAQPLTNLRCFLEVAGMRKGTLVTSSSDLKTAEQQADRAIVVVKTISSLVREISVPTGPWISLNSLLDRIFDDFVVLEQSGLLTLERRWDSAIQVTSNPALQQLLALLTGKLAVRNTRPITLTVSATMVGARCHLEIQWRPSDKGTVADAETTLAADLVYIQEIVFSLGGEIAFEGETGISLKLPGMLQSSQNIIAS
jgi:DNA-binding response OmpR family regulator